MTPLLLAQSTQPLSFQDMGMIVLAIAFLSRWLWDYKKHQREESASVEPKSNPPLHERFISRPEYVADQEVIDERLNAATASRKAIHKDVEGHGHRLAALEKGEKHTEAALASIDTKVTTLLQRTAPKS